MENNKLREKLLNIASGIPLAGTGRGCNSKINTASPLIEGKHCIDWTGGTDNGYPRIWDSNTKKNVLVHRLVFQLANKDIIIKGRYVLQACGRKVCVNPRHLYLKPYSLEEKIIAYSKINLNTPIIYGSHCRDWTQSCNPKGYGQVFDPSTGRPVLVHRALYELNKGIIAKGSKGLWVFHHCNRPCCCAIEHLFLGTAKDNLSDMIDKGIRCFKGERNPNAKFTDKVIDEIRERYENGNIFQWELAKEYGISQGHISEIINRKTRNTN